MMKRPIISRNEIGPNPHITVKLRMARYTAWLVAWILYHVGELIGKIMCHFVMAELFPIYNYMITKSYELSENYDLDIWKHKEQNNE